MARKNARRLLTVSLFALALAAAAPAASFAGNAGGGPHQPSQSRGGAFAVRRFDQRVHE